MRYMCQTALPEVGREGQKKIESSRVVCIGLGGLGCAALPHLVSAGVGELLLVDGDHITLSNLPRQTLYTSQDVGRFKADVASERLRTLNENVTLTVVKKFLTPANVLDIFKDANVIIDGTDRFSSKFLINDAAVKLGLPVVWGAATGWDGQVCVFWGMRGPCYRCFVSEAPQHKIHNCHEAGVLGPIPGLIGVSQALECLKLILNQPSLPVEPGNLTILSGHRFEIFQTRIPKRPGCLCHSPERITLNEQYEKDGDILCPTSVEVDWDEVKILSSPIFIDVRESAEHVRGCIPESLNLPLTELESPEGERTIKNAIDVTSQDGTYLLYCQSGRRSLRAASMFRRFGISKVFSLKRGYAGWLESIQTSESA